MRSEADTALYRQTIVYLVQEVRSPLINMPMMFTKAATDAFRLGPIDLVDTHRETESNSSVC